jgi:hypothetical protein
MKIHNKNKKTIYVSASDVSDTFFCTYRLKNKVDGMQPSKYSLKKSIKGNKKHDLQNRVGRDKRCFVATYAYGVEDFRTIKLRKFRDQCLNTFALGRLFVFLYYFASPYLVVASQNNKKIDRILKKCLNIIMRLV